jgi:GR25 family glycosyltransferase involved in LPS biosynthesis
MAITGYIIRLESHDLSREWSKHALTTGQHWGWNLVYWPGVDGRQTDLAQHGIAIYQGHKKCRSYMARAGTQGCFLSHYQLWYKCASGSDPICIFEHDVEFLAGPPAECDFQHVLKFEGFRPSKPIPAGQWWEGARAYVITPQGAHSILDWVHANGAMPADWMLCDGIVDVKFDTNNRVRVRQNQFSFTRDLQ